MKVLHAAAEIAGQAGILCRALRGLGVDATALAYNADFPRYPTDVLLPYDGRSLPARLWGYLKTAVRYTGRYDLIHVHFGRSLVPPVNIDIPLHDALGTRLVFHFHGCEVRNRELMRARHEAAACTECRPFCLPERQRHVIDQSRRYGAATYVSTPDLLESVPHAEHLPVALDVHDWEQGLMQVGESTGADARGGAARARGAGAATVRGAGADRVVVFHVPTDRRIKGTRWIEAGVAGAQAREPRIVWALLEQAPWQAVREAMEAADIVVDQVFLGWYGLVAVEAMALGKPVVGFIRSDFEPLASELGLPLVRTTRHDVGTAVLDLARDPARRRALGEAGREYARRVHGSDAIARRLVARYEDILGGAPSSGRTTSRAGNPNS